ncbi:hypothetical protein GCM10009745_69190 [Kribbella yunnanensis]|uniref:Uncharacterized protein n=1 Tax=Kribbella yunnanensis TaxID=190194 RepID=A0ABP4UVT8_9ACTN
MLPVRVTRVAARPGSSGDNRYGGDPAGGEEWVQPRSAVKPSPRVGIAVVTVMLLLTCGSATRRIR